MGSRSDSKPPLPGLIKVALVPVPAARPGDRRLAVLLLAGLIALPMASRPLAAWAANLPDWAQPVRAGVLWWDATMNDIRLTVPYDELHRRVRELIASPF